MNGTILIRLPYLFYTHALAHGAKPGRHTMKAYYYASGKNKFLEVAGKRFAVSGMREARKLCKDLNAQPWNF